MAVQSWALAIRLLALRNLRRRPARTAVAVVAVGAGVSLLSAVVVEQHSTTASVADVARTLAGPTPLRVVGPTARGGLAGDEVERMRAMPGVRAAVPVVQAVAQSHGDRGDALVLALGVDCSVQAVVGDFGCSPRAVTSVHVGAAPMVSARLLRRLGPRPTLRTDLGTIELTGAPVLPGLHGLNAGRVVVFPLRQAQREFARGGRVDAVYVQPTPGVDVARLRHQLAAALPGQDRVLTADAAPDSTGDATITVPELGLIGLLALGIGGLLVFNVTSLSLAERRRELAIASALGGRRWLVTAGILAEAGAVGVLGGALGSAAGLLVAYPLVASLSHQVELFTGIHVRVHPSLVSVAAGVLLGLLTGLAAAWLPARRATRIDVVAELRGYAGNAGRPTSPHGRRAAAALAVVGGCGVAACLLAARHDATASWQPPVGVAGLLVANVALVGCAVPLAPMLLESTIPWSTRRGGTLALALRNLVAEPRRLGVAATAVAGAVALSSVLVATVPTINAVTASVFARLDDGRVYVSPLPFNNTLLIDSKASPTLQRRLAALPDAAAVDRQVFAEVTLPSGTRTVVSALEGNPLAFPAVEGSVTRAALARGEVFVGPGLARLQHLRPGSRLLLDTPAGRVRPVVRAVWEDPNHEGMAVTMSSAMLERLYGRQPPSALFIRPKRGVSAERLAAEIRHARLDPALRVETPQQFTAELSADVRRMMKPFWTLQTALLTVALIVTLSTLLLVGVHRRREMGVLAALGMGPRSLARMTVVEAGVVGAVGGVLGVAAGVLLVVAMLGNSPSLIGSTASFHFDLTAAVRYAALATVAAMVGALWPAWRTSRLHVVDALRHE